MPEFGWVSTNERQPAAPGRYLTRRDLKIEQGRSGYRKINTVILPARYDGQTWALPVQPDYWRDLPAHIK